MGFFLLLDEGKEMYIFQTQNTQNLATRRTEIRAQKINLKHGKIS